MISSTNTSLKFQFTWYKYYYLTFSYVKLKGALKQLKNFFIGIFINDNPNRKEFDNFLEKFSQDQQDFKISKKKGSILIDGMWDNAGHWTRYLLVRKAINIYDLEEICLLGRWNKIKSKIISIL